MSPAEVEAKFRASARGRLSAACLYEVVGKARQLVKLASVADLMQRLAAGGAGSSQT